MAEADPEANAAVRRGEIAPISSPISSRFKLFQDAASPEPLIRDQGEPPVM
jgi:hypothetical protein